MVCIIQRDSGNTCLPVAYALQFNKRSTSLRHKHALRLVTSIACVPQPTGEQIQTPVDREPKMFRGVQRTVQNLIMAYLALCDGAATL